MTIQLEEINQSIGERRKIKKLSRKDKIIQTKQNIPKGNSNNKWVRGDETKTY